MYFSVPRTDDSSPYDVVEREKSTLYGVQSKRGLLHDPTGVQRCGCSVRQATRQQEQ